jgi:hypothetical protein
MGDLDHPPGDAHTERRLRSYTLICEEPHKDNPTECLVRHEAKHSNQWAWLGGNPVTFGISYGLSELISGGPGNVFEGQAGLRDGGYRGPSSC